MIQGTILKKKKPLCLNVVFSTCDFIPITGSTAHQITITAISHIHLISDFFSTPVTFSFFPSLWALICAPPVYLICLQVHSKEENISRAPFFFFLFFSRSASYSQSACHTDPDQIHCHLASVSAEELNVHHSATGVHCRAVGTLTAIACYGVTDVNYFCHMGAKDKLLLIM